MCSGIRDSGFRSQNSGLGTWDAGHWTQDSGFRIRDPRFGIRGLLVGVGTQDSGFKVKNAAPLPPRIQFRREAHGNRKRRRAQAARRAGPNVNPGATARPQCRHSASGRAGANLRAPRPPHHPRDSIPPRAGEPQWRWGRQVGTQGCS